MPSTMRACLILSSLMLASPAVAQGFKGDVHVGLDSISSDGESQEGVTYGLTLSYDLQRSRTVIGVQVDLDATDNQSCESDVIVAGDRVCIAGKRDNAVSLRLGGKLGNSTMIIGTIGYANGRFEASYAGAGINTSAHKTLDGVRVGIGLQVDVARKLYARADYRYTNYEQGVSRNQGIVGLGLKF
jgi:outer membrane immunogenic protein